MISSQLLFLFSALGAVNGMLLSLYLFSQRSHRMTNYMLGGLLLVIGVRTVKSTFYYFNPDLAGGFIQFGLAACLMIGPLTYLYVHSYLADLKKIAVSRHWYWHLLMPCLLIGTGIIFPYAVYPAAWFYVICGIHLFWFGYLLLAGRQLWLSRAVLSGAAAGVSRRTILMLSVYGGSALILLAYVTTPFTSYIVGALSFTFSIHVTILSFLLQKDAGAEGEKKEKYQNRKIADHDARAVLETLTSLMREQQLYLNPLLSLALLAKKSGHTQAVISQVINDSAGKSFNLYMNEFRIHHAKQLLMAESHLNMELVAERSGFNSNSTFFAAFKKIAGQTPASYRASCASDSVPS